MSNNSTVSAIESFSQPYRLTPKEQREHEELAQLGKNAPEGKPFSWVYGGYIEELRKLHLDLPKEMLDYELTNFLNNIDDSLPIEKEVKTMVRIKATDLRNGSDRKRKEFLVWYTEWHGHNKDGVEFTVADYPNGMDKHVVLVDGRKFDNDGNPLKPTTGNAQLYYTVEFDRKLVEEIIEKMDRGGPDTVQYIVTGEGRGGNNSWGGFSYDEFKDFTFDELEEIGRNGRKGQPRIDKKRG